MKGYFCKRILFLLMVCLVTLSLCGTAMAQKFNGIQTWTGTWTSGQSGSGPASLTLTQTGQALAGSVTISNIGDCGTYTFPVTGSAPDYTAIFAGTGAACGYPVTAYLTCTASGNTMSGYFLDYVEGVPFDAGTFTATGGQGMTGDFAGTWTGSTSSYGGLPSSTATFNITQMGPALSGNGSTTINIPGYCQGTFPSLITAGTVSRFNVAFSGPVSACNEPSTVQFYGTLSGSTLTAIYFDYANNDIIDFGTLTLNSNCSPPTFPSTVTYYFDPNAAPLNPEFIWSRVADTNLYDAQICSDSACSSAVVARTSRTERWRVDYGSVNPLTPSLNPGTPYWLKVRSVDFCGIGPWSTAIPFTTSSCAYYLSSYGSGYGPQDGYGTVTVTPSSGSCSWTATSNDSWIHVTSGSSGTGTGTVSYHVDANYTGLPWAGSITIGGQGFTVYQVGTTFIDDPNNMFSPHIYGITTEGITRGCWGNPNYFCPNDVVTRGAMAAFIIRAIYGEDFSYTQTPYFTDVPPSNGYFKYVQKMRDVGITAVVGTYMVDDVVTRGAMAAFIIRAKFGGGFSYTQTPYFIDVPESNGYFKYVQKMKDEGITGNVGTYNWTDVVIRQHMAAFLARAFLGMQ